MAGSRGRKFTVPGQKFLVRLKKLPVFPCLTGNSGETGSLETPCTAIPALKPPKLRKFRAFRCSGGALAGKGEDLAHHLAIGEAVEPGVDVVEGDKAATQLVDRQLALSVEG